MTVCQCIDGSIQLFQIGLFVKNSIQLVALHVLRRLEYEWCCFHKKSQLLEKKQQQQ